jgi:integrase
MSITRRSTTNGVVYDVRLRTPEGKQYKRTFRTRHDADAFRAQQIADRARGTWLDPRGREVTFGDWAREWLKRDPSKRPSSLARDESILRNHLLPTLESRPLGTITPRDIQTLVNSWTSKAKPSTVGRQYDVLRAILAAGVELDMIGRSPCHGIKLPQVLGQSRRVPQPEELASLAAAIDPESEAMVWLGALLGLRWGECAGLRVGRIDFLAQKVHVVEQVTRARHGLMVVGPPKSEAGRRALGAPAALIEMLAAHMRRRGLTVNDPDALLFTEANGDLLDYSNWRSRVWLPACKAVGLGGLVFHDLRRVNATALVAEGVDLKTAQSRLGHSDPRLTLAIYAQATTDGDAAAAELVAARLMPPGSRSETPRPSGMARDAGTTNAPSRSGNKSAGRSQSDTSEGAESEGAESECAIDAPWRSGGESAGASVTALTRRNRGREGGIRTRDLSVPNAAR